MEWNEEDKCYIEDVPEGEFPDCMNDKHRWTNSIPYKTCILCGKSELLKPDFTTGDVRDVS
jgi:hypothetical protein